MTKTGQMGHRDRGKTRRARGKGEEQTRCGMWSRYGWQIEERDGGQTGMRMGAEGHKFEQQWVTGMGQQKILMR